MDRKKFLSNLKIAFISQAVATLVSAATSLIVPKFIGVAEYGYLQLFIFYVTYTGFFHLGLNDGVYLINGGKTIEALPKQSINSQFVVGTLFQSIFSIIIFFYACFGHIDASRSFVISQTAIMIIVQNASWFWGYIFQAVNSTSWYSLSLLISRGLWGAFIIILLVSGVRCSSPYIASFTIATIVSLFYCIAKAKPILKCGLLPFRQSLMDSIASVRVGIKLMLANLSSMLILGIARVVIDSVWGIETFGQFSLSLQLITFILSFLSQVAMVLFPSLKTVDEERQEEIYADIRDKLDLILPLALIGYYPAYFTLNLWLPTYSIGLRSLYLLLPICIFDGKMQILFTTFFKILRRERQLFIVNFLAVGFSLIATIVVLQTWCDPAMTMVVAVLAVVLRSFMAEKVLSNYYRRKISLISISMFLLCMIYLVTAATLPLELSFGIVTVCYLSMLFMFRKQLLKRF